MDLHTAKAILGGDIDSVGLNFPDPDSTNPSDRSARLLLGPQYPNGFYVLSWRTDDQDYQLRLRDWVRERLGLSSGTGAEAPVRLARYEPQRDPERARAIWREAQPVRPDTPAWTYLRRARGYEGTISGTLRYLAPKGRHAAPALVAAMGCASEAEPGRLCIRDEDVHAVHIIRLLLDGSDRLRTPDAKLTVGRGALGAPIMLAPLNDLLGLVIAEGIEDALTAHDVGGFGAWAAGGATRMPALAQAVPDWVNNITILVDANEAGRRNALKLAENLCERGFEHIEFWGGL